MTEKTKALRLKSGVYLDLATGYQYGTQADDKNPGTYRVMLSGTGTLPQVVADGYASEEEAKAVIDEFISEAYDVVKPAPPLTAEERQEATEAETEKEVKK